MVYDDEGIEDEFPVLLETLESLYNLMANNGICYPSIITYNYMKIRNEILAAMGDLYLDFDFDFTMNRMKQLYVDIEYEKKTIKILLNFIERKIEEYDLEEIQFIKSNMNKYANSSISDRFVNLYRFYGSVNDIRKMKTNIHLHHLENDYQIRFLWKRLTLVDDYTTFMDTINLLLVS